MTTPTEPPRDRLPGDRDLPDPRGRLESIIREATSQPARRPFRPLIPVAAAVALIVALVAVGVLIRPSGPGVVGNPPSPATPSIGTTGPYRIGDRVELAYVAVTLREARQNKDGLALAIETCLVAAPPTGPTGEDPWYSWEVVSDQGTYVIEPFKTFDERGASSVPVFPGRSDVDLGDCVEGWLPFAGIGPDERQVTLSYRDSLDESARWTIR